MQHDYIFAAGLLLCFLSVPALVSAWSDRRRPSVSVFSFLSGAGLIGWIWSTDPDRYAPAEVPHVLVQVYAGLMRALF